MSFYKHTFDSFHALTDLFNKCVFKLVLGHASYLMLVIK